MRKHPIRTHSNSTPLKFWYVFLQISTSPGYTHGTAKKKCVHCLKVQPNLPTFLHSLQPETRDISTNVQLKGNGCVSFEIDVFAFSPYTSMDKYIQVAALRNGFQVGVLDRRHSLEVLRSPPQFNNLALIWGSGQIRVSYIWLKNDCLLQQWDIIKLFRLRTSICTIFEHEKNSSIRCGPC